MICAYSCSTTTSLARRWQALKDRELGIDSIQYRGTRGYYPTPGVSAKIESSKEAIKKVSNTKIEPQVETEKSAKALSDLKSSQNRKVVNPKYRGAFVSNS